jgi:hypothetical protein
MNEDSETENLVLERAIGMRAKGYKMNAIAKELNVHVGTVRRWFRKIGMPAMKNGYERVKETDAVEDTTDHLAIDLEDNLEFYAEDTIRLAKHDARIAEDSAMMDIAEAQTTPADKYQHYIAAAGIKILRDSIKNLKGPKTVRELSELDQLIRRNLGLNAKSGGGQSKMHIDISILNNSKADRGDGTVTKMKPTIIDID